MRMLTQYDEKSAVVQASVDRVFAYVDDHTRLAYGDDRQVTANALRSAGAASELGTLAVLANPQAHHDTKVAACHVLRDIGTRNSLPTLNSLATSRDVGLRNAAAEAVRVISTRP